MHCGSEIEKSTLELSIMLMVEQLILHCCNLKELFATCVITTNVLRQQSTFKLN